MKAGGGNRVSGVLAPYSIMQQNTWSGRVFYTAQERRTGQVTYLVEEPVTGKLDPYTHPALPPLELVATEGETRWLRGVMPSGDALEDLRNSGRLKETDMVAVLLSVVDGLVSLSAAQPALVPSYLDPACIKRDHVGRWLLDYLALAHAPEARMAPSQPLGVHPMGVLLYWLVTGQAARRTRVQVKQLPPGLSPTLQFIMIKCLGRSYPSLAELRRDIERAASEHEFRSLVKLIGQQRERAAVQPVEPVRIRVASVRGAEPVEAAGPRSVPDRLPGLSSLPADETGAEGPPASWGASRSARPPEHLPAMPIPGTRALSGGPFIPMNDRPWAAPPRPDGGYRQAILPPPPTPRYSQAGRWTRLGLVGVLSAIIAGGVAVKAGFVPEEFLPEILQTRPAASERTGVVSGPVTVGTGTPSSSPVGRPPEPPIADVLDPSNETRPPSPRPAEPPPDSGSGPSTGGAVSPGRPARETPAPRPQPEPPQVTEPAPEPKPVNPGTTSPPKPTPPIDGELPPPSTDPQPEPSPPAPEPGSIAHQDANTGGLPFLVFLDEKPLGRVYLFPNAKGPYLSLGAYNSVFGRNLYWAPEPSGQLRIYTGVSSFVTENYEIVNHRVWLQLTPVVQRLLHIQLSRSTEGRIYFLSR